MRKLIPYLLLSFFGCTRAANPASAEFDQKWSNLVNGGKSPAYVESETHGSGLLGEVRRSVDSPADRHQVMAAVPRYQGELPDQAAENVVRHNLGAVRGCYALAEKQGAGTGKAIVTIEIDSSGVVHSVAVDAPAFLSTSLPACVGAATRAWTFPKFTEGPKRFTYPLVFAGG